VRRAPLRFAEAVGRLNRDGVRTWLELGAGDGLTRLLPECLPDCLPVGTASAFALSRDWAAALRPGCGTEGRPAGNGPRRCPAPLGYACGQDWTAGSRPVTGATRSVT
jgi:hypothetical protein